MTRLLFAAARGARIDIQGKDGNWYKASAAPIENKAGVQFRIHPDDEHLQYGPVSTALRENAQINGPRTGGLGVMLAIPFVQYHRRGTGPIDGELHRTLFLLILAEALADEGL